MIDACDGDHLAALFYAQLRWWFERVGKGPRDRWVKRNGQTWLARGDHEWSDEVRLTIDQVRRLRRKLAELGLVEVERWKVGGRPMCHLRPVDRPSGFGETAESLDSGDIPIPGFGETTESSSISNVEEEPRENTPLPPVAASGDIEAVFDAWILATGRSRAVLDGSRRSAILKALRSYPVADLVDAVRGWRHSPFHCGQNDKGTVYNDLTLLLRDAKHLEEFRDWERYPDRRPKGKPTDRREAGRLRLIDELRKDMA